MSFPHPLGGQGIGTTAWHQAVGLANAGAEVTVVCTTLARPLPSGIRVIQTLGPVRPRMMGVDRARRWHDLAASRLVVRLKPQVVHMWPRAVLRTTAAAARVGAVSLREAPSPYTRVAVQQAKAAWDELGLSWPVGHFHHQTPEELELEDREFRAVDAVLTGSSQAADSFTRASFPVEVRVHGYGYDPGLFAPPSQKRTQAPTVLFVGRCEPAKGIHVLLRAWQSLERPPTARLVLCGTMTDSVRLALRHELDEPDVRVVGRTADVAGLLGQAEALVLPSFSEGSALVGYEALGAGVVPLVSSASGVPVDHGVNGLVHGVGAVSQLRGHLETVLAQGAELARLRQGVLDSRDRWTWDEAGRRLLSVYADVMASLPTSRPGPRANRRHSA